MSDKKLTKEQTEDLLQLRTEKLREARRILENASEMVGFILDGKYMDLPARILGHSKAGNSVGVERIIQLQGGLESYANMLKQDIGRFNNGLK